jgi:folate-binding protein YgfZ
MTEPASPRVCALDHYTAVRVHGPDAAEFLQAQLVNDAREVSPQRSQLTGWCNPKGRLLAVFRLFRHEEAWFLRLPSEIAAPTLQRLRMFVLRAKVQIEPLPEEWAGLALWGTGAERLLEETGTAIPGAVDGVAWHRDAALLRVPGEPERFELWGPQPAVAALARACERGGAAPAPVETWELAEIRAGLPEIYPATREQFVPQTVNMDLIGALSFTKGCYPGQEIVARTRYLGKLKRRMYRLRAATGDIEPGQAVYRPERSATDPAGTVVRAAPDGTGGVELLASLRIADLEAGALRLGAPDGPTLERLALPYAVTAEQD